MHPNVSKTLNVGITGQSGFIGGHLYNTLKLEPSRYKIIEFRDSYFDDESELNNFVAECDVIVHLAAVNRHESPHELYEINVSLVTKLIRALETTPGERHIIFSSSIQESLDNYYGSAKKFARQTFSRWASENNCYFSGLIIPNVFGPFGKPYYNSVISTFCHQLTHNETPAINIDSEISLIYVGDLIAEIINIIDSRLVGKIVIEPRYRLRVSNILQKLQNFRDLYFLSGEIPSLIDDFDLKLFNVFRSSITIESFFPFYYTVNQDDRGAFIEAVRVGIGGQFSYSTTHSGITRGNHFHTRKIERFAVIKGSAKISLRRIGQSEVHEFFVNGGNPAFIDMPIWYTHNITNIGDEELITLFWINEKYDLKDPDTFMEKV